MRKLIDIDFRTGIHIWLADLAQDKRLPAKKRQTMEGHIENHVMRYFCDHTISRITGDDLQRLRWSLTCSASLAGSIIKTLRTFFDYGVTKHWVAEKANPALTTIAVVHPVTKWWRAQPTHLLAMPSYVQLQFLATHSTGLARTALNLFIFAGLRGNEARALRKRHLKSVTKQHALPRIDVCTAFKSQEGDSFIEGPPKTRAGQRFVFVGPVLNETLNTASATLAPDDFILNLDGEPLTHWELDRILRMEQVRLGIGAMLRLPNGATTFPGTFGIRHLRHAFVALLIFKGFADRDIAEVVGHSSSVVTLDVYGYLFELYESAAPTWPSNISPDNDIDTDLWELAA
ncbi:site-specific integrase [Devosia aurantiaca]|uniref:Tyr recombinase domain-containing protein n=1 Tax=Devosia aurantiaca TaxID=2714858 RepID=A0A6M1SUF6_9HYPH|nr:hypothetical protein [Devosia aurantiaca]NGP16611.1 hypothetical protein [Devosia aurantiaca]